MTDEDKPCLSGACQVDCHDFCYVTVSYSGYRFAFRGFRLYVCQCKCHADIKKGEPGDGNL